MFVTLSSLLVPIIGEYERTSTTSINGYLGPVIHRYINGLERAVRDYGFKGPISIMESGGGVLPASEAAFQAANLLTSGRRAECSRHRSSVSCWATRTS